MQSSSMILPSALEEAMGATCDEDGVCVHRNSTRAEALDPSMSCSQVDIAFSVPAVGGWDPLTPATTRHSL